MTAISGSATPPILQTFRWISDPLGFLHSNAQQYGDLFTARIGVATQDPLLFVSHPEAIQQMLTQDTRQLSAPGELNEIVRPLLGDRSLILISGEEHRRRRQLVMPPFHGERLKTYGELICNITRQVMSQWQPQQVFTVRDMMQQISMRVILQAVFGLYEGDRYYQLETLLRDRLNMTGTRLGSAIIFLPVLQRDYGPWSPGGILHRMQATTDELIFAEINERRAETQGDRTDILSLLLAARDENGNGLTDVELRDELMTLLVAGHETTATALTWALYWVHRFPEVKAKLLNELSDLGPDPDPAEMFKLPYLTAVCNETLRIYPVALLSFPRRVETATELMGHPLQPGTILMACIYLLHHRPDLYPNPEQFRPERFLERQYSPYEFMPFGGGSRRCVGAALAQYELKLALGTILLNSQLALTTTQPIKPQRRGITLGPGNVRLRLENHRPQSTTVLATH